MANHLVIIAGGIGSRFWPISKPKCPKRFLDITGKDDEFYRYQGIIDNFGDGMKIVQNSGCMVHMPKEMQVVIQGLNDCIVAEHDVLLICQLSEKQRIKEWYD